MSSLLIIWLVGTVITSLISIGYFMKIGTFTLYETKEDYRKVIHNPPLFNTELFSALTCVCVAVSAVLWMFLVNIPIITISTVFIFLVLYTLYCIAIATLAPETKKAIEIKESYKNFVNKYFTKELTESKE